MRSMRSLVVGTALVALTACGGGGGGGGAPEIAAGVGPPLGGTPAPGEEAGGAVPTPPPTSPPGVTPPALPDPSEEDGRWFPGEPGGPTAEPGSLTTDGEVAVGESGAQLPPGGTYLSGSGAPQQPVPEPETVVLFLIGSLAVVGLLWRRGYLTLPQTSRTS